MRPIPCERVRVRVRTDISLTVCDFGSMLDDICAKIMRRTRDSTHVITRLVIFECISRVRAVLCCTHVSNSELSGFRATSFAAATVRMHLFSPVIGNVYFRNCDVFAFNFRLK